MTWATLAFSALNAAQSLKAGRAEARAAVDAGNIAAINKSRETLVKAGRLQSSFLNSGVTLEGTPMTMIENAFDLGTKDINQIATNANTKGKNSMIQARSKALGALGTSFSNMGGVSDIFGDTFNGIGQDIGGAFDPSATGPYQSPWG